MIPHRLKGCEPFVNSNDYWSPPTVKKLIRHMQSLRADYNDSAALIVGAGTLPFALDILPRTIVSADLNEGVVKSVIDRCSFVANTGTSWDDYVQAHFENGIGCAFGEMSRVGMARDFAPVKAAARRAQFIPLVGNVVTEAPEIAKDRRMRGKKFSFIHFTNIAQYIAPTGPGQKAHHGGRTVLADLLQNLPLHEKAIICDSSSDQTATLFTPAEYAVYDTTIPVTWRASS